MVNSMDKPNTDWRRYHSFLNFPNDFRLRRFIILDSTINFSRALKSLRLYPLPLKSGRECGILKGFNLRLCALLDEKLNTFNSKENNAEQIMSPITIDEYRTRQEQGVKVTGRMKFLFITIGLFF